MNIHEYQGKAILKDYGAPVSAGFPALTVIVCALLDSVASGKNVGTSARACVIVRLSSGNGDA